MAKDKRRGRSRVVRVLEQKRAGARVRAAAVTAISDATGSCRYTDVNGQIQCESPVPKSYCDDKGGFFTPDGRC